MKQKSKKTNCNCQSCDCEPDIKNIKNSDEVNTIINQGIVLEKCQKCGCMTDLVDSLLKDERTELTKFRENAKQWKSKLKTIEYSCLGCKYCYPAVASNILFQEFGDIGSKQAVCSTTNQSEIRQPVVGEYFALCNGRDCSVSVSTLSSVELAEKIATLRPEPLCIVGKTETENIGIDKIIKNIIADSSIQYLILSGIESGHKTGETLLALMDNGVDENNRVIGSSAIRPILMNVTHEEIQTFREQIDIIDLISCTDETIIISKINELGKKVKTCTCKECIDINLANQASAPDNIIAKEPNKIEMDKSGYFVVYPQANGQIVVEHYANNNILLRTIRGHNSRDIYWTIIENGWITQLSHAAYLGKELTKAELSIKHGIGYIQDGA